MSKHKILYWSSLIFLCSFFLSCKVNEKDNVKIKVKYRSSKFLVKKLKAKEFKFNTLSAKASIAIIDSSDKKTSFKIHLRIRKDSVVWMSITPLLGIEMARVVITKDSVKFLNRASKEYFLGDFEYINKLFGTQLDYQMLEALLVGNSISFNENEKIHSRVDRKKNLYYLSTEKKRKVRKELQKEKDKIRKETQVVWLEPVTFKIKELLLSSPETNRSLMGVYTDYREVDTQLIAFKSRFILSSKTKNTIDLKYAKISVGKNLTFPFKISSKYVQIKK